MSSLQTIFNHKPVFIPFIVAGDPDPDATVAQALALVQNGADALEIGIPFSDPVADGPVIQAADLRAFAGGISVAKVFDIIERIHQQTAVPLVLLTYANIPFKYGYQAFCQRCADLGVAGLVIPDLPMEEAGEILPAMRQFDLDLIPLVSPTSMARIPQLVQQASGFIYVVSAVGVTGQREQFAPELEVLMSRLREATDVPLCIGFGVHTPTQAKALGALADGVIVGSAVVALAHESEDAPAALADYAKEMAAALHEG